MCRRVLGFGVTAVVIGGLCIASTPAVAEDNSSTTALQPSLSTGPGQQGLPLLPRGGGGGDELWAGDPTCIPNANTLQVGIANGFSQVCGDGLWVSLAYPVLTGGATIESINIIHNTNTGSGDLYLMGDCGGNPDVNNILWAGCECIEGAAPGAVTNYCIGDPIVDPPATLWVVAVFRDGTFTFDIAFDCNQDGPGQAYGNLAQTGNCGDWTDLDEFVVMNNPCPGNPLGTFGGCAWVSLVVAGSPGLPECCDSPAMCDGDVNGDGLVDPLDSGFVLARFGLDASDPANCPADANCDGLIDPLDSGYVLARFGLCNEPVLCPLGGGDPGECGDPIGCGDQCGTPLANDCCEVHMDPGCDSVCGEPVGGEVEECVCVVDNFCCDSTWDAACVEIVELFACADCSDNNPDCAECAGNEDCPIAGHECIDSSCICVETAPVNDDCEDAGDPETLPAEFAGTTNCAATNDCAGLGEPELWHSFTIDSTSDVVISWCGSPVTHSPQWIVITASCPCGDLILYDADTSGFGMCAEGADNMTARYPALPPGTYWAPVYSADDNSGLGEDYVMTIITE